jgi:Cft2 family RNA processing exonuclease
MSTEEFKTSDKTILLEKKDKIASSYKIRSYQSKIQMMDDKKIPQKDIKEVLTHFFKENNKISKETKDSISKLIYCQGDRIIIAITGSGQDIIQKRNHLINDYGWFFFVKKSAEKESGKKRGKKPPRKQEETISTEEYQFNEITIILKEKKNMRGLYSTKEYAHFRNLIRSKKIAQMPIKEVLSDFFSKYNKVPIKEKKAIKKTIYYQEERVIVVKSLIGDKMYENLEQMVKRYGWYFYITGVPVGESEISLAIEKVEKRFNQDYFKEISLKFNGSDVSDDIRVTIYPVVLRPNHNCHILGLGKLNILLDCALSKKDEETEEEGDLHHIEDYLENLSDYLLEAEKERNETESEQIDQEKNLKEIKKLREFDEEEEDLEVNENEEEQKAGIKTLPADFIPRIDAIFVSHSHFDHISGLKELIKLYPDVPVLCSRITLDLYLLRDSKFLKQENRENVEEEEYKAVIKNVIYVEHGEKIEFKDKNCYFSFFHAGHMPGALMLSVRVRDFRFLYTGDYSTWDFSPFAGTGRFLEQISRPIDYLLIDATCAYEEFDSISNQLHSLILFLEQKAEYGDNCLIGADPSSLAITFLLMIWRHFRKMQLKKNYQKRPNIYVDMMVRKNIQVINHHYEYIYGPISNLIRDKANPFNSIKIRWFDRSDLEFLRTKNNIIITHPPDLAYGIIRRVINKIGRAPHNLVFLSGAIHEQPGLDLISDIEELRERDKEKDLEEQEKESEEQEEEEEVLEEKITQDESEEEIEEKFENYVSIGEDNKPLIHFSETWTVPFRALLLNKFAPNLKIKLHADKKQLTEMVKALEPQEVCFFHQSPKKLVGVAEYIRDLGIEKVGVSRRRKLKILY